MAQNLRISVLMATFNGASHLREQMDSILKQEGPEISLYISDDGSTDSTVQILQEFENKFPSKIHLLPPSSRTQGACIHFLNILQNVDSDLFLFADQDDIWTFDHVKSLYEKYQSLNDSEKAKPILIFSDMKIIDANGKVFADSFLKTENLPQGVPNSHFYFVQNNVSGCVSLLNSALKRLVLKNSELLFQNTQKIPMHDFFFATTAATFGNIYFVRKLLSFYRKHANNAVGIQQVKNGKHILKRLTQQSADLERSIQYTDFFATYFKEDLEAGEFQILQDFANIKSRSKLSRIGWMLKHGFLKYGIFRKCVQLWNA